MTQRSGFLSAVGWASVCAGALKLAFGYVRWAMLQIALPLGRWGIQPSQPAPRWLRAGIDFAPAFAAADCALAAMTAAAGAGVLLRRDWGRKLLIAALWAEIARASYGLTVQAGVFARMTPPPLAGPLLQSLLVGLGVGSLALSAGLVCACLWLIVRLHSPDTLAEFGSK